MNRLRTTPARYILAALAAVMALAILPGVLADAGDTTVQTEPERAPELALPADTVDDWGQVNALTADAHFVAYTAAVERAEVRAYLDAVHAERVAAAEAAAERKARERAAARTVAPARVAVSGGAAGPCGGWEGLVASYFPGEVAKACSVLMCESNGNPNAANPRSTARGLMQLMMSVHANRFYARGWAYDDWRDPGKNLAIAAELRAESGWGPWVCS